MGSATQTSHQRMNESQDNQSLMRILGKTVVQAQAYLETWFPNDYVIICADSEDQDYDEVKKIQGYFNRSVVRVRLTSESTIYCYTLSLPLHRTGG